jgi:ribonuclease HI
MKAETKLKQLCGAILSGRRDDARTLAQQFALPKPKGSSIVRGWFDGACWPNPSGHGGYGALVKRYDVPILSKSVYMGHGPHITNNVAEYAGCVAVLRFLLAEGIQWGTVYGDSRMVVQQLNGEIKAKHGVYLPLYREARELRAQLPDVRLVWISRGINTEADKLSKEAIKPFLSQSDLAKSMRS